MTTIKFYYYRRERPGCVESDGPWTAKQLSAVPDKYKARVVQRYEGIFLQGRANRRKANLYLNRVSKWFRRKTKNNMATVKERL